jgi:hypothetical protein
VAIILDSNYLNIMDVPLLSAGVLGLKYGDTWLAASAEVFRDRISAAELQKICCVLILNLVFILLNCFVIT